MPSSRASSRPGQRVVREEIAERVGVSVVPLRALEQEGQLTYLPRRGYFVTSLCIADLEEIYGLREILEERAVRHALPTLDEHARELMVLAAKDCLQAALAGDVSVELQANRRFHFAILQAPDQSHALRLIQKLWDSTGSYRALYYNSPVERRSATDAHDPSSRRWMPGMSSAWSTSWTFTAPVRLTRCGASSPRPTTNSPCRSQTSASLQSPSSSSLKSASAWISMVSICAFWSLPA